MKLWLLEYLVISKSLFSHSLSNSPLVVLIKSVFNLFVWESLLSWKLWAFWVNLRLWLNFSYFFHSKFLCKLLFSSLVGFLYLGQSVLDISVSHDLNVLLIGFTQNFVNFLKALINWVNPLLVWKFWCVGDFRLVSFHKIKDRMATSIVSLHFLI